MAVENRSLSPAARTVFSGTLYSFAALVGVRVLTVGRSIAMARILGRDQLGFLTVLNQVVDTVSALAGFGITIAMTKFIAGSAGESRQRVGNIIKTCFASMSIPLVVACASLYCFAPVLARGFYHDARYAVLFRLAAGILALQSLYTFGLGALQGLKAIKQRSLSDIVTFAVGVPAVIALTAVARITGAVIGQLVLVLIGTLVVGFALLRFSRILPPFSQWRFDQSFLPQLVNLSLPFFLAGLAMTPAVLITTNMLFQISGSGPTGLFNIALTMFSLILFVPLAVGMPLIPVIAETCDDDSLRLCQLTTTALNLIGFITFLIAAFVTVFARAIVFVLYGRQFVASSYALAVMAQAAFFSSLVLVVSHYLTGTGRAWTGLVFNALWFVTIVVSARYLIVWRAGEGLALAWWIAYLVQVIIALFYLRLKLKIPVFFASVIFLLSCTLIFTTRWLDNSLSGSLRYVLSAALLAAYWAIAYVLLPTKTGLRLGAQELLRFGSELVWRLRRFLGRES